MINLPKTSVDNYPPKTPYYVKGVFGVGLSCLGELWALGKR